MKKTSLPNVSLKSYSSHIGYSTGGLKLMSVAFRYTFISKTSHVTKTPRVSTILLEKKILNAGLDKPQAPRNPGTWAAPHPLCAPPPHYVSRALLANLWAWNQHSGRHCVEGGEHLLSSPSFC